MDNNDPYIDIEKLSKTFQQILINAVKSNNGNVTAGRRFRILSSQLEKEFLILRKISKSSNDKIELERKNKRKNKDQ